MGEYNKINVRRAELLKDADEALSKARNVVFDVPHPLAEKVIAATAKAQGFIEAIELVKTCIKEK